MKISELEKLKNSTDVFRIKYDKVTAETEYEEETVTDEAGATALMDYTRTSELFLSLINNVSNAHNVRVERKAVGVYGGDAFELIAKGKDKDMTAFTLISP